MSTRCPHCRNLSVETLVELAQTEFEAHGFPQKAYYQHHESFDALEQSAQAGCDFCQLVLDCFRHTPCEEEYMDPVDWPGDWDENIHSAQQDKPTTMYDIVKDFETSDVKLCINASHLYLGKGIDDVQVFDEIVIQVGPMYDHEDSYDIRSCPLLRLTLSAPRDNIAHIGKFRIGRYEVDPNPGSAISHGLAKQWLSDCRRSHKSCLSGHIHELPTRAIDVGGSPDPNLVRLLLSNGAKADYVALSHCWGGVIFPLLTTETMAPFQDSIAVSTLPANFRDAITITRNLGIRYLWIDSLCIQQDSKSDWEKESKKMGHVYRNSTVTISAMASAGSKQGILNSGHLAPSPDPVSLKVFKSGDDPSEIIARRKDPNEDFRFRDTNSALTTRGWTLQEYILSPRHVLYGRDMVYWRCPQGFITPDGLPSGNHTPEASYADLSQVIYSDILRQPQTHPPDIEVVLRDYYELVNSYTERRLTYGADKLPAFSGLAQRLHPIVGGDYLAGLWTTDFRRGLVWLSEMGTCRHVVKPYRAPSWSWAVSDDLVVFADDSILKPSPSSAELLEYCVNPRVPDNPYGELLSATIVVKALAKPFVRSRQVIRTRLGENFNSIGTMSFDEPLGPEDSPEMVYPSLFRMETDTGDLLISIIVRPGDKTDWEVDFDLFRDGAYILMLVHTDDNEVEDSGWSNSDGLCLILQQAQGESPEAYERVGFARIQSPKLSWLKTWERQVLTLV